MKSIPALSALLMAGALPLTAHGFQMDPAVPAEQKKVMLEDYGYLDRLQILDEGNDLLTRELLETPRISASQLKSWLSSRMKAVISEKTEIEKSVRIVSRAAYYQNGGIMPDIDAPVPTPTPKPAPTDGSNKPAFKPMVVMSNMGTAIYMHGKQNAKLLGLQGSDGKIMAMRSPRDGLVQIGEGLFHERLRVNPERVDLPANRLARLSTYFHEARHSDGNGKSLGFAHAMCPVGHAYQGYYACEKNLNGPYTIGAMVLKKLTAACSDCSAKEKTTLQMIQADSLSRVLKTYKNKSGITENAKVWNPAPEKVLFSI
jgi:hypothetical protein